MHVHGRCCAARSDTVASPTEMTEAEYPSLGPASAAMLADASPAKAAPGTGQWASIAASPQRAAAPQQPQAEQAHSAAADAPGTEQVEGAVSLQAIYQLRQPQLQPPQHGRGHTQGQQGMADQVAARAPSVSSDDEDAVMADLLSGLDVGTHAAAPGALGTVSAV